MVISPKHLEWESRVAKNNGCYLSQNVPTRFIWQEYGCTFQAEPKPKVNYLNENTSPKKLVMWGFHTSMKSDIYFILLSVQAKYVKYPKNILPLLRMLLFPGSLYFFIYFKGDHFRSQTMYTYS